jgi:putative redox protein
MPTETVTADWVRDQEFLLRDHAGFPILMAEPKGVLGADRLPLSLAGCTIRDVMDILRKQRQPETRCQVDAESERQADSPWRFRRICIVYRLWGTGLGAAAIERAIRLTQETYCSVYATLKAAVKIVSRCELHPAQELSM